MVTNRNRNIPQDVFFDNKLHIIWYDGTHMAYKFRDLRVECPCASCVDEISGEKVLDPDSIDENIYPLASAYVGNYALEIRWSDGHDTGIYTFEKLRDEYPHETFPTV